MTRTTDQWGQLLDGSTEGPWKAWGEYDDGTGRPDGSRIIRTSEGDYLGIMQTPDSDLAAAAPDAVAEVVRLRRELETMRDDANRAWGRMIHHETDPFLQGAASEAKRTTEHITRILNPNGKANEPQDHRPSR